MRWASAWRKFAPALMRRSILPRQRKLDRSRKDKKRAESVKRISKQAAFKKRQTR